MRNSKYTDYELVKQLKRDDQHAFKEIYDQYHQRVYQIALRYLKSPQNAQEVVQDVFMKLWVGRNQLAEILTFEAWIYTVAKNNILNRLKRNAIEWKAKKHFTNRAQVVDEETFDHLLNKEYTLILKEAINDLPAQQKLVFEMARHEKLTYAQIGEKLNISPLTVKTHMSRALQEIRKNMADHGIEIPFVILFLKIFL